MVTFKALWFLLFLMEELFCCSCGLDILCDDTEYQTCFVNNTDCVCSCRPGYYQIMENDISGCTRVKTFGGMITFNNLSSVNVDQAAKSVEQVLTILFNDSQTSNNYFLGAKVVRLLPGSMQATYEVLYQNSANVNANYVEAVFRTVAGCTTADTVINSLSVDLIQTCSSAVSSDSSLLCNASFLSYCDSSSTYCVAGTDGYVTCNCKNGFTPYNSTLCVPLQHGCSFDDDCNRPFGSCVNTISGARMCSCTWGVSGDHCRQAWLLIFTVVTTVCGFVIVCLLAVVVFYVKQVRKYGETRTPTFHPSTAGPTYSFSSFPPGKMRAHYPEGSTENFVDVRNKIAASSASMPAGVSAGSEPGKQRKYSYLNHGFDTQEEDSPSPTSSPEKTNIEVKPNNYF